jgi:hypothetical protein
MGHDVLTSLDAGRANASVPDSEVLDLRPRSAQFCRHIIVAIFCVCIDTEMRITQASSFAHLTLTSVGWRDGSTRQLWTRLRH